MLADDLRAGASGGGLRRRLGSGRPSRRGGVLRRRGRGRRLLWVPTVRAPAQRARTAREPGPPGRGCRRRGGLRRRGCGGLGADWGRSRSGRGLGRCRGGSRLDPEPERARTGPVREWRARTGAGAGADWAGADSAGAGAGADWGWCRGRCLTRGRGPSGWCRGSELTRRGARWGRCRGRSRLGGGRLGRCRGRSRLGGGRLGRRRLGGLLGGRGSWCPWAERTWRCRRAGSSWSWWWTPPAWPQPGRLGAGLELRRFRSPSSGSVVGWPDGP